MKSMKKTIVMLALAPLAAVLAACGGSPSSSVQECSCPTVSQPDSSSVQSSSSSSSVPSDPTDDDAKAGIKALVESASSGSFKLSFLSDAGVKENIAVKDEAVTHLSVSGASISEFYDADSSPWLFRSAMSNGSVASEKFDASTGAVGVLPEAKAAARAFFGGTLAEFSSLERLSHDEWAVSFAVLPSDGSAKVAYTGVYDLSSSSMSGVRRTVGTSSESLGTVILGNVLSEDRSWTDRTTFDDRTFGSSLGTYQTSKAVLSSPSDMFDESLGSSYLVLAYSPSVVTCLGPVESQSLFLLKNGKTKIRFIDASELTDASSSSAETCQNRNRYIDKTTAAQASYFGLPTMLRFTVSALQGGGSGLVITDTYCGADAVKAKLSETLIAEYQNA